MTAELARARRSRTTAVLAILAGGAIGACIVFA